jgi:hypothetical protein
MFLKHTSIDIFYSKVDRNCFKILMTKAFERDILTCTVTLCTCTCVRVSVSSIHTVALDDDDDEYLVQTCSRSRNYSQLVCLGIEHPCRTCDQILLAL